MATKMASTTSYDLFHAVPSPEVLTSDFVIRSLRRRLRKAFQDDDGETALRAYQATRDDFERWLQDEEDERMRVHEVAVLKSAAANKCGSKDQKGSLLKRMSIKDTKQPGGSSKRGATRRTIKEKLASSSKAEADLMVSASKSGDSFHSIELKQLVGPILESQMNPSEPFIADDFLSPYDSYDQPAKKDLPDLKKHERELQARKRERSRRPRMAAFNIFRKSDEDLSMEGFPPPENDTESESILREDINMTTPLHEAARLGSGDFIRFLLANGGDPNVKNGHARTALHMCAGGFTVEENRLTQAMSSKKETNKNNDAPIGIRAPAIPPEVFALMNGDATKNSSEKGTARKAAKAVGRMIQSLRSPVKEKSRAGNGNSVVNFKPKPDPARLNHLVTERMDAALAVLSWIHEETGEGASINAVDSDGRTALHYAAEMGRSDICMIILSNFGAMLTIIDELGARTPCELAGVQGHSELAAQLEARAVLYIDPYGVDDELMANYLNAEMDGDDEDGNRTNLVAPFSWFETSTLEQMGEEREKRLQTAHLKMKKALQQWECGRDMKKVMASATKVGLNAALSDDENDAETDNAGDGEKAGSASENENSSGGWEVLMTSAEVVGMDAALGIEPDGSAAEESEKASAIKTDEGSCNSEDKDVDDVQVAFSNMQNSHVERFLAHHKWHVSQAIKVFRKSPGEAFVEAGVPLPSTSIPQKNGKMEERMCLICYDDVVEKDNWVKLSGCIHGFCADCLRDFVKDCAASKLASVSITCPHHECEVVMSQEDIDSLLLEIPDVAARITEANNEQFVSSAYDFRFCTHPGCPGIVKRLPQPFYTKNNIDLSLLNYVGGVCTADPSNDEKPIGDGCTMTYEGVEDLEYNNCRSLDQPRKAHRFCFACGEGMHWPVRCEQIEQWKQKMREEIGEVDEDGENDKNVNDMAQKLWLKANTRPCPQCNVPIEKNDGCNHMTCTSPSCRHEFCWICRKDWKLHGTATGGFFRCNIWQEEGQEPPETNSGQTAPPSDAGANNDPTDVANDQGYGTAIHSAREAWKKRQEMARFVHHYTRWEAHGESAALERNMGDTVCTRLAPVVEAAMEFDGSPTFNFGGKGLSFVHSAFTELLECRSVLKHSYAYSFFRYPTFYRFRRYNQLNNRRREKVAFERLQSELEMMTEQMSDVVARAHVRATQVQITFLTAGATEKRQEFNNLMFSILNEERKEEIEDKSGKSSETNAPRSSSRHRHVIPSPFGAIRRVVDDNSWSSENDDDGIRSTLEQFMSRAVQLDGPEGNEIPVRMWACTACTYMNNGHRCAMCGGLR